MRPSRWRSVLAPWGVACVVGLTLAACRGLPPLARRPQPIPYADTLPIHEPANLEPNEIMPLLRESTVGELGQTFDPDDWGKKNDALNLAPVRPTWAGRAVRTVAAPRPGCWWHAGGVL